MLQPICRMALTREKQTRNGDLRLPMATWQNHTLKLILIHNTREEKHSSEHHLSLQSPDLKQWLVQKHSIKWKRNSNKGNQAKVVQAKGESVPCCPPYINQTLQADLSLAFSDVFSPFNLSILIFARCIGCMRTTCSEESTFKAHSPQGAICTYLSGASSH